MKREKEKPFWLGLCFGRLIKDFTVLFPFCINSVVAIPFYWICMIWALLTSCSGEGPGHCCPYGWARLGRVPVGGTRSREAAAVVALGQPPLLAPGSGWSRHGEGETELAVLETGFNKYFGTRTILLQAEIFLRREAEGSLKMAHVVYRVAAWCLKPSPASAGCCVVVTRNYPFIMMWTVLSVPNISLACLISSLKAC